MKPARALLGALAGAQVAYGQVRALQRPAGVRAILGMVAATSAVDAVGARGGRRGAALLGSAAAVGLGAELVGTATGRPFGHYTYSGQLGPRWRGVPLMAGVAWAAMARPAWVVAGLVERRRAPRAALAAGALTAWDVFLDPRMVREGYWSWPGGGRYEDVPASNFAGWLATATVLFALWSVLDPWDEPAVNGAEALALYGWTAVGETFANAVLWDRPRVAAAGGTAMGAFLIPALVRRRGAPAPPPPG